MAKTLILTLIGQDRPGLVDAIAETIIQNEGNWLGSRLAHLGGEFAGMVQIEFPENKGDALIEGLQKLADAKDLKLITREDTNPTTQTVSGGRPWAFEILGQDRPGIIRAISGVFAEYGVNVEELTSEQESAAMSGEKHFRAKATVIIPKDCDTSALQEKLESLASELMVDFTSLS